MKSLILVTTILLLTLSPSAQEKPRVFIKGQGTVNATTHTGGWWRNDGVFGHRSDSTADAHNESIELAKDMRAQCPELTITLKEDAADYLVMLNRESKAKKGLLNKNSQVLVANKQGDIIWTKDVRQVTSAAKDACAAILTAAKESGMKAANAPSESNTSAAKTSPDAQSKPKPCVQTSTGACEK